jgi:hypothetical protein
MSMFGRRAVLVALVCAGWACSEDEPEESAADEEASGAEGCVSDLDYFQQRISVPLLEKRCLACHTPQGAARHSKLVLAGPGETNYLQLNFERVKEVASLEKDGTSLLLLKPSAQLDHGGGQVIEIDGSEYEALQQLLTRFDNPTVCETTDDRGILEKVRIADLPTTLRKAKIALIGDLPLPDELQRVSDGGEPALDALLDAYMEEEAFYENMRRWWNDLLLTDKYIGGDNATNLLNEEDYPNRHYYRDLPEDTEEGRLARQWSNPSVARAGIELIIHLMRTGKPFTEVLTADYILVNPFSARVYGLDIAFDDPLDPNEWREGRIPGIPHAGILTDHIFLRRYPTTDTNVNRHRARMTWRFFLATDVLKKAERPIDPTQIQEHNPTMNTPACNVCHATIDPIAGSFQNWDENARYRYGDEDMKWSDALRPPGFGEETIPPNEYGNSLQWLAQRIIADERFALSPVYVLYQGMLGRPPVENPTDETDPRYEAKLAYFNLEQEFLQQTAQRFRESGFDLRSVVRSIVKSPFYRAYGADPLGEGEEAALEQLGRMRLLTPEELHQRILAVLGTPWKVRVNDRNPLLDGREFKLFYGGIDSDDITRRITEPNGIMANIGLRMAMEMGCISTPRDFGKPRADRILFPHVEPTFEPEDENGFLVPSASEAIRQNIRYLHQRILGEVLPLDHPEVDASYQLFLQTWREGVAGVQNGQLSQDLPNVCRLTRDFWTDEELPNEARIIGDARYTLRAWAAVVSYLLADWRFLYE